MAFGKNSYQLAHILTIKSVAAFGFACVLAACGDDNGNSRSPSNSEISEYDLDVESYDDLPVCTDKREGSIAYVKDEKKVYGCADGEWIPDDESSDNLMSSSSGDKDEISSNDNGEESARFSSSNDKNEDDSFSSNTEIGFSSSSEYKPDSTAHDTLAIVSIKNKTITGVSQKGPFVNGSSVTIQELDGNTLAQTGKSFKGKISNDKGEFSVSSVSLVSRYAILEATGYYRNEITGKKSGGTITLNALTDLSDRKKVNINLLTHLEYERALHLIGSGMSVSAAKKQAEAEILNAFGIKGTFASSEDLDVFDKGDGNAALLAFSVLMLCELSEADLTERLTKFAMDVEKDGKWDDDTTKVRIADWASRQNLESIRKNMERWDLGEIPDFEKFVRDFWSSVYELGECSEGREGEVIVTKNKLSWYYNTTARFICKKGSWNWATDLEKDTYLWLDPSKNLDYEDGDVKYGEVVESNCYVFENNTWRSGNEWDCSLGFRGCTELRQDTVVVGSDSIWYTCDSKRWRHASTIEKDTATWGHDYIDGDVKFGNVYKTRCYVYENDNWRRGSENDCQLGLRGCTELRQDTIGESLRGIMYICDSLVWRYASDAEIEFGACSEKRKDEIKKLVYQAKSYWFVCEEHKWKQLENIYVDTRGWSKGYDGEVRKGDSTETFYKYDDAENKWVLTSGNDVKLGFDGCVTNRVGEIARDSQDVAYVCENWGTDNCYWYVMPDTYGEICNSGSIGKMVNGIQTPANKYYCAEQGWLSMTDGWNWNIPKEARMNSEIAYDSMIDPRDGKVYRIVTVGEQIWMAENLNYADSNKTEALKGNSWCYDNNPNYCDVTGRYYTWAAAKEACPPNWHLPTREEYQTLFQVVKFAEAKSQTGWNDQCPSWNVNPNGSDDFGFSVLPAGLLVSGRKSAHAGVFAYFWTFSEVDWDYHKSYTQVLSTVNSSVSCVSSMCSADGTCEQGYGMSVRCVKD